MTTLPIKNIAFYSFFKPSYDLENMRDILHTQMQEMNIKGSILFANEGINGSLCGITKEMNAFLEFLFKTIDITPPELKISYSKEMSFKRIRVRVKTFIVPQPGATQIDLAKDSAPYISPQELHQWFVDNKKIVLLDTRNEFEYQEGHFKNSIHLGTQHFAEFEKDLEKAPEEWKSIPIVTFCTGGIRCEKAAPLMLKKGFGEVYQLQGGILNYFKEVGRGYFKGECFVFDERVAVDEELKPKKT
jgi:UPF0176 protein